MEGVVFIVCLVGVTILPSFVLKQRSCHDENSQINMKLIWRKIFLCNLTILKMWFFGCFVFF